MELMVLTGVAVFLRLRGGTWARVIGALIFAYLFYVFLMLVMLGVLRGLP